MKILTGCAAIILASAALTGCGTVNVNGPVDIDADATVDATSNVEASAGDVSVDASSSPSSASSSTSTAPSSSTTTTTAPDAKAGDSASGGGNVSGGKWTGTNHIVDKPWTGSIELIDVKDSGKVVKVGTEEWPIWEIWGELTIDDGKALGNLANSGGVINYSRVRIIEPQTAAAATAGLHCNTNSTMLQPGEVDQWCFSLAVPTKPKVFKLRNSHVDARADDFVHTWTVND